MPCALGVASLSAPRPASLGLLSIFVFGILVTGLVQVLAVDCFAFVRNPSATLPPRVRFGDGISCVSAFTGPPLPQETSVSRWRLPRAPEENVAVGVGQATSPVTHSTGYLQTLVLATLAESLPLHRRCDRTRYLR